MKINTPPQTTLAATAAQAQTAGGAKPLSAFMMAPVELTPLAPPSSAPASPAAPAAQARSPAAERRQAFFAERQKALLDRLNRPEAMSQPAQAGTLPAPQRAACVAVLQNIAAASAAGE